MGVVIIDGPSVVNFVNDSEAFDLLVNEQFDKLRINHDHGNLGLSVDEFRERFDLFWSMERELVSKDDIEKFNYAFIEKFDVNQDGFIDCEEHKAMMKEFLLIVARSVGDQPLFMALEEDSLLFKAVQGN